MRGLSHITGLYFIYTRKIKQLVSPYTKVSTQNITNNTVNTSEWPAFLKSVKIGSFILGVLILKLGWVGS